MTNRYLVPTIDAGADLNYLLRDEFNTADAAPLQDALATAGSATVGTETNTYAATHANDGTEWIIDEINATPAITLTMNFTAPVTGQPATQLIISGYYDGNAGHTVNVDAYDWITAGYDNLGTLPDAAAEAVHTFTLDADHTDTDGSVLIRINHTSPGNPTHVLHLDWVYIQDRVRPAQPGPGTLTIVDTNNIMSIAGGAMVINGTTAANNGIVSAQFARSAGLLFYLRIPDRTTITTNTRTGWATTDLSGSDIQIGFDWPNSTTQIRIKDGVGLVGLAVTVSTATDFACIMRGTGGFLFYKNTAGNWQLLWVYNTTSAAQYAKMWVSSSTINYKTDSWRIVQLATPFTTDFGYATDRDAGSVAAGATFTHEADCHIEFVATTLPAPGNLDCFFRVQDANNYWIARVTAAGTLDLIEVVAGGETSRGSGGTVTNGERIVIKANNETITGYANLEQAWSYSSAANFKTETDGELDSLGTGGAVDDLVTWPLYPSLQALSQLNKYTK